MLPTEIRDLFTADEREVILRIIERCDGSNTELLRMLHHELPHTVENVEKVLITMRKTSPE